MSGYALGLIETRGLIGAIEATDAAAKAAAVVIASAELTDAAFMTVRIEGELGAVQAAVEAGAQAAARIGELVAAHVIARPSDGLGAISPDRRYVSKYHDDDKRRALQYGDPTDAGMPRQGGKPVSKQSSPSTHIRTQEVIIPKVERVATPPEQPKRVESVAPAGKEPIPTRAELEAMPVVALRQFARNLPNLPIQGRQISMANRQQLLDAIATILPLK